MWNPLKNFFNSSSLEKQENCQSKESIATSFSPLLIQTADATIEQGDRLWQQGQIAEAITFYRQALAIDPNSSKAHQKLALALQKQGNLAEAMIHYRKAIVFYHHSQSTSKLQLPELNNSYVLNPVCASARASVSFKLSTKKQQQLEHNNDSEGLEKTDAVGVNRPASSALIEVKPIEESSHSIQGYRCARDGRTESYSENTMNSFSSSTEAARIYLRQALSYCDEQQWSQAIAACQKALELAPKLAQAYKIWGNALLEMGKHAEAMGCYAEAIAIQPDLTEVYANMGSIYARQQKWQQAIEYYQKALAIDPEFTGAYRHLGRVWQQLGESLKAWECQERVLSLEPEKGTAAEHLQLANELKQQGQLEKAVLHYRYAIKIDPNLHDAYQNLAETLEKLGQWQEAATYYRQLIEVDLNARQKQHRLNPSPQPRDLPSGLLMTVPQLVSGSKEQRLLTAGSGAAASIPATARVIHVAEETGKSKQARLARAMAQYRQKAEQYPDSAEIQANLGSLYARQQQWQEAIACYRRAIELNPQFTGVYRNLARVLDRIGQKALAAQHWYRAFSLEPNNFKAEEHLQLGNTLWQQGKLEQAAACYRRAIQFKPSLTEAYLRLGEILQSKGQQQEAITCYRQAVKHSPQNAQCFYHLALALAKLEQWDEAITSYQRSAELQPHSWEIAHHLGDALSKQQRWQEAIEAYERAIELKDDFAWSHNNLGDAFLHLQQWEKAARSFRRAIELNPDFPWSHYNLGEALVCLEQWDEAIAAYRKGVELQPDLPQVEQKIEQAIHQRIKADEAKAFNFYLQAIAQEPTEIENYLKALAIQPQNLDICASLSQVLLTEEHLARGLRETVIEELIACYQTVIAHNPRLASGYLTLAKLMEVRGERQLACQYRYRALQLEPERASAAECVELGNALLEEGKRDEAVFCYQLSLSLDPSFRLAYFSLGKLLEGQEALDLYRQAVEQLPADAQLRFHLGRAWTKQQNWQEAIACYETTVQLQPDYWQAYHHWGDALCQQQRWQEAIAAYRQAIEIEPHFSWSYYNLGVAFGKLSQWEEAFTCYQKITEIEPDFWQINQIDFQLQHQLGDALFEQQKWAEAIIVYQRTIALQPDYAWAHYNLGRALLRQERPTEAIASFRQATQLDPNFAWAYYYLGDILTKQGIWDEAIASYRRAVQLQPDLPLIHAKLADALGRRSQLDSHHALTYYQEVIKQNPDDLEIYHKALELQPNNSKLYFQLANTLVRQNQLEQAVVYYQLALQYQPHNAEIISKLTQLSHQTGAAAQKLLLLGQLDKIAPQPEKAEAYLERGKNCIHNKQLEQAIVWLQTALEFHPHCAEAHFQLGNALTNQANLDRALVCYRKAIELEPENCWYYNGYGDALTGRWDLSEALEAYNRAIQLNPDFEGFYHNRDRTLQLQSRWQRVVSYCQQILTREPAKNDDALRLLLITPYPPYPPNTGGAIRMFEQIKYLGSRHHLTVVSFIFDEADYAIEESLQDYCDFAIVMQLGVPLSPRRVDRQNQIYHWGTWNMWKVLQQLAQIPFDAVLFDFIFSTPYISLFQNHTTILNEHNIESRILQQCARVDKSDLAATAENVDAVKVFLDSARESRLLENYENQTWPKFTLRTVVSQDDKEELERRCPGCKTIIVKNGIDTRTIVPLDSTHNRKMLYMGTMAYYPNIDAVLYFVEEILPRIRQEDETLPFCIAGRDPSPQVQALSERDSYIEIVANPENMSDVARDCSMTVVPIRLGSGTRIKILHSMAMGLPVISTSLGCEGLEVTDGENILIRDEPEEFAEAVLQLSSSAGLRNRLRVNGRKLVEQEYDWQSIFSQYEREILSLTRAN